MIGAVKNPSEINGKKIPEFKRYRQFYFSVDTDLYHQSLIAFCRHFKLNRTFKMIAPATKIERGTGEMALPVLLITAFKFNCAQSNYLCAAFFYPVID